jgi:YD repeat-containing protein
VIRTFDWPWETAQAENQGSKSDPVLQHPHRAMPDPATGELVIDPEIVLKAKGFDLQISLFYSSTSASTSVKWGKNRSASVNLQLNDAGPIVVLRGDGSSYDFHAGTLDPSSDKYSGTTLSLNSGVYSETFPDGKVITYGEQLATNQFAVSKIQDPSGNIHTYSYDKDGNLESIEVPGGNLTTFNFDAGGHVESIEDWSGRFWTFTYSGDNLASFQTPTGCISAYAYETSSSRISAVTDPRGYTTSYTYNADDRVETVSMGAAVWTYTYGNSLFDGGASGGSVIQSPSGALTSYILSDKKIHRVMDPRGFTVTYGYDSNGRKVLETMPYGDVVSLTLNSYNLPLSSTDPLGNITTYQYDASNNLTTIQNALGQVTTMAYDGSRRMISSTDPLQRTSQMEWNSNGTLKAQVDPRGLRTTFSYDSVGNVVSVL